MSRNYSLFAILVLGACHSVYAEQSAFQIRVVPFLESHCIECHAGDDAEGGITFDQYSDSANVQEDYELWEKVIRLVKDRQMPPADMPQPTTDEVALLATAIEAELAKFDCTTDRHPGRVTIRRLNRAEYNNTIRDLTGLDLKLADDFPSDDVGYGFDNVADVLTIPPILMEKYLAAAETVASRAFADEQAAKRLMPLEPESPEQIVEVARKNVRQLASRAYRRPITDAEEERLFDLMRFAFMRGSSPTEISELVTAAILSNPNFLYRIERDPEPNDEDGIRELDGYELATRLSYFLWSSMPDKRLFDLAESGELTRDEVLESEVRRMLADPKSDALVENFAGQWLQLRDVPSLTPDPDRFPDVDTELRGAMRRETELFVRDLIREDRSVLDFLSADFTYVNQRLAQHYGIQGIEGSEFQRVTLTNGRRGVLTHASILMLTSNPTRTSPVKRGKWILENFLAEPPPPPPPDVPELEESGETLGTLREQLEQHRTNESCAVCHRTMDALGFGLENFDAVGAWRDKDGRDPVDSSGELPGGRQFKGAAELMEILADEKREQFCRCLAEKLTIYALGRGLGSYDRCTIKDAVKSLQQNDYRFSVLVTEIVKSDPFRMREAKQ